MAQLERSIAYTLSIDVSEARRTVKRVLALAGEANRQLARLEDRVDTLQEELAAYGIKLEVQE